MKKIITIFGIIFVLLIGALVYFSASKNKTQLAIKEKAPSESLVVSPQIPKDKVVIDSATLTKKGFVVVREIDKDLLGQVIEISKPLDVGKHSNLTVNLGNAKVNGELIVMIYDDYENDGAFNDFDQPTVNKNGDMIAKYVTTGKPIPTNLTDASAMGMAGHNMPGMTAMAKIHYTDKGFVPANVVVPVGSMVEFVNESSKDMWVASTPHPQHTDLPTFDEFKPAKKGTVYRFVFEKKGTWGYHDHINPSSGGIVKVL